MDIKTEMTKEQQLSVEPEQQQTEEQPMSKSSNSSVYSSSTTGTTDDEQISTVTASEGDEETDTALQKSEEPSNDTTDGLSPPAGAVTAAKAYYEDLVKECKVRMANTFDTLEAETGIRLTEDGGLCMVAQEANNLLKKSTNPFANHSTPANTYVTSHPLLPNEPNQSASANNLRGLDHVRMEKELRRLKEELALKNDIVEKMCRIRTQVEAELEDLTASLFEEANKMVYTANVLRDRTEKDLVEATLKIDMLTAEVDALKLLVITSTPSRPNPHLHPQIGNTSSPSRNARKGQSDKHQSNGNSKAKTAVKKSPSNYELGNGSNKEELSDRGGNSQETDDLLQILEESQEIGELDPLYYTEFIEWKKAPTLEPMKSDFMKRIYDEEIYPVFNFKNKDLTAAVLRCIESNSLIVESVTGSSDGAAFPKRCALLEVPRSCSHRMKLQTDDQRWYAISALCRNRIAAVCDLFCYLGYIKSGLVKSDTRQMYWQIMRRRHSIVTSKLGFQSSGLLQ